MSEKHYNISYLENTGLFLKNLKEQSYHPFKNLKETILDLGCGTGQDVIKMAEILNGPKIIGLDHDPVMIEKANSSKKDGLDIEFKVSESETIPYGDDFFSGVRAERLIQHLIRPETTFTEVYRVLKQGSPFLVLETDWASLTFYNEHVEILAKLNYYLTVEKINNGYVSRKLVSYLKRSGFAKIAVEVFPFVLKTLKEANEYLWIEFIVNEAAEKGFLSIEEKDILIKSFNEAENKNYFTCSINMLMVTSYK